VALLPLLRPAPRTVRLGGAAALGSPTGMSEKVGDGTMTPFGDKGTIFTSPAGSYLVQGEILKSYLKNINFKLAETRHFIGLTNFATKKEYTDWFNRYLLGTEWPKE